MAGRQNEPVPTKLVLLADLETCSHGDKVRFLGCVTNYSPQTAILTLEHNHPPKNKLKALVNLELLVNSLKSNETRIGEWLNVIGYIQTPQQSLTGLSKNSSARVQVQAILLWSSGPLKLDGYEKNMDQQKADMENI